MSEEEELDFDDPSFILAAEKVEPLKQEELNYKQKRLIEISKQLERGKSQLNSIKSRKKLEEEIREEGLRTNLIHKDLEQDGGSKALKMMKGMGFKPGEALGKQSTAPYQEPIASGSGININGGGIGSNKRALSPTSAPSIPKARTEPLTFTLREGRKGLGTPSTSSTTKPFPYHLLPTNPSTSNTKLDLKQYQLENIKKFDSRRIESLLLKLNRTCEELDRKTGLLDSSCMWLQEPLSVTESRKKKRRGEYGVREEEMDRDREDRRRGGGELGYDSGFSNFVVDDEDEEIERRKKLEQEEKVEEEKEWFNLDAPTRLAFTLTYLRTTYNYCLWCGCQFTNKQDLNENCPVSTHIVTNFISPSAWALVESKFSQFAKDTLHKLCIFVEEECMPAESTFHDQILTDPAKRWTAYPEQMEVLKRKAKSLGLWNLFLSKEHYPDVGVPLTNLEYAVMAEIMGRCPKIAPEACNCSAPDTGNMEVFARYGTQEQKDKWLVPLLDGRTRSSFAMTEKGIASSDATNIQTSIRIEGNEIVINGHKWWISGAGDPRNAVHLVMGKSDVNATKHQQQSIVIIPANAPGVKLVRPMHVFGYDDAPEGHYEVLYTNVRVPLSNIVGGFGRGFEIIQGRLGPGRIHHCMRSIGMASRALDMMLMRVTDPRKIMFGKMLFEHGTIVAGIAQSRMEIEQARLLVLSAALQIDLVRAKGAMKDIGMAKAIVPKMVGEVIDRAMQVHGAEGICQDTPLAALWAGVRTLRFADGPDEVHIAQIGLQELKRAPGLWAADKLVKERELKVRAAAGVKKPSHM